VLCVGDCVYNHWGREPINIGRLQRYATESALKADPELIAKTRKDKSGKKVALIGAGPASLAAAGHLALDGHSVTIFEKRDIPGGLNTLGIAPYKMHGDAALAEVSFIQNLGDVTLKTGATAFIERMKRDPSLSLADKRRVLIIGGGNTAIDIAHEMALLGCSDVAMVYRRSESAMSAYKHEMKWGREDGVRVIANTTPAGVVRNKEGKVIALKASKAANGKAVPGSEHEIPCDFIALAVGQARLTQLAEAFEGVKLDEKGRVIVDTNTGDQVKRAFDAGWGGAVWKTLGNPIRNVSSRFGGVDYGSTRLMGLNNIELITDRPLEVNLKEMLDCKKQYPKHTLIASLMVETKAEWREIIQKVEDVGSDLIELNFGCPHGMCERGMGSAVGQEPKVLTEIVSWVKEYANIPVIVKLTPNVGDITEPARAARAGNADAVSLINTIKSIVGVDLDKMVPQPVVGNASSNGGYCGPAVKPIALHMVGQISKDKDVGIPISGIGGISNWRDAAEFMALGSTSVQVCTAVMHYGYRIVEDMIEGLNDFLDEKNMKSAMELVGKATDQYKDWGDLDINYHVVADIDEEKCIGCQLCYVACMDGSHQCIHIPGMSDDEKKKAGHVAFPTEVPDRPVIAIGGTPGARIPFVHEQECVGCNLCALVCPVPDCISMVERRKGAPETWNKIVADGRGILPGGLDAREK